MLRTATLLCLGSLVHFALAQPVLDWASTMGGPGSESGSRLTRDALGNTYITGTLTDTADFDPGPGVFNLEPVDVYGDFFVQKLDVNGALVWAKSVGSIGGDMGNDIAVDASGNVYVAGHYRNAADFDPDPVATYMMSPVGVQDGFILKLDNNGEFLWAATFGTVNVDGCRGLALNSSGNIVFCGFNSGPADMDPDPVDVFNLTAVGAYTEGYACELTASGDFVGAWLIGGTYYQNPFDIAVDASDNIYMVGRFDGTTDFDPGPGVQNRTNVGSSEDIFLVKLNAAGAYQWVNTIGSTGDDIARTVAVDGTGNVHIAGEFSGTADFDPGAGAQSLTPFGGRDVHIASYTAAGQYVWAGQFGGTADENATSIFALPGGEVLCTGIFSGTVDLDPGTGVFGLTTNGAFTDGFLLRLDNSGALNWAFAISGPGADAGSDVHQDATGALVWTGSFSAVVDLDIGPGVSNITSSGDLDAFVCTFDTDLSVGIDPDRSLPAELTAFPVPFSNELIVHGTYAGDAYVLCDATGRIVQSDVATGARTVLRTEALRPGAYIVRTANTALRVMKH